MFLNQISRLMSFCLVLAPAVMLSTSAPSLAQGDKKDEAATAEQKTVPAPLKKISPSLAPLLGKAYKQMNDGKFDPAVKTLSKAVSADKESITARRYLAFALVKNGDPKDAIKELNRIVQQENKKPTYFEWCTFGEAYLEAGALDRAESCYKQALKLAPTSEYAKSGLIRVNMKAGNYDEAKQNASDAMKATQDKDHYNYYKNLYIAAASAGLRTSPVTGAAGASNSPPAPAQAPKSQTSAAPNGENAALFRKIESNSQRSSATPGG